MEFSLAPVELVLKPAATPLIWPEPTTDPFTSTSERRSNLIPKSVVLARPTHTLAAPSAERDWGGGGGGPAGEASIGGKIFPWFPTPSTAVIVTRFDPVSSGMDAVKELVPCAKPAWPRFVDQKTKLRLLPVA